ncbi:MAG: magnesium-translocating P-type ATPase [Candidatus Magasanikbacteria bacterium]
MPKFKHLLTHSAKTAKRTKQPITNTETLKLNTLVCLPTERLLKQFQTSIKHGLASSEAKRRLFKFGKNEAVVEKKMFWPKLLFNNLRDPLSVLLIVLATASFLTKDYKATVMIGIMVVLSVFLRFFQEIKADKAAKELKAMVHTTVKVVRAGKITNQPLASLVPGDIIHLSAGDMVPADVILLTTKNLFVNQATLTGESLPVEKNSNTGAEKDCNPLDLKNVCFLGTNIEVGSATALVVSTGKNTYLGAIAKELTDIEPPTSFDVGVKKFTWLIMTFILIMVPLVFLINGLTKGDWLEAIIFALAVAVGLAPEMLPMIVAVNLSKGALSMSKKKVIVKHLNSVQNFGSMDILCTDKTGTITEGRVILEKYLDVNGEPDENVLNYAFLNSYFQTGLNNLMDASILKHTEVKKNIGIEKNYKKIDEIPFDFNRRRMSVVVENERHEHILICKGALEEIIASATHIQNNGKILPISNIKARIKKDIEDKLNCEGFRVVAIAYKKEPASKNKYSTKDESDLILLGFLAFLDPPKATAKETIAKLEGIGIKVMVLTGDNELVTKKICSQVGLETENILLGSEIENLDSEQLKIAIKDKQIFAKLTPLHKEKIVHALRDMGHVVGFMGDGINDAPALRAADIGISVDSAADIAKESSDIILLEKSLAVLQDGVLEGRKIFGNITKYIKMAASSNFGNMFSVVGASIFLPFLPMLPIQILTNNLLYDVSQTAIPTDNIDPEFLKKPRRWEIKLIKKFILFIGPISSIFDFATYGVMWFVFKAYINPSLFQTGWFVESLVSQTLIIYIIRTNKIPFLQSWPSKALLITTLAIVGLGCYLPFSPLATTLKMTPLPFLYWIILSIMIVIYFILTQTIKTWFNRRYQAE